SRVILGAGKEVGKHVTTGMPIAATTLPPAIRAAQAAAFHAAQGPVGSPGAGEQPATVRGDVVRGRQINGVLSDGRTLSERDAEVRRVDRNGAWVDGRKLFLSIPASHPAMTEQPLAAMPLRKPESSPPVTATDAEQHGSSPTRPEAAPNSPEQPATSATP